jgi:hypothetical protein
LFNSLQIAFCRTLKLNDCSGNWKIQIERHQLNVQSKTSCRLLADEQRIVWRQGIWNTCQSSCSDCSATALAR